ncbi:hypothetical protein BST61_g11287 [Cercospora zeina]
MTSHATALPLFHTTKPAHHHDGDNDDDDDGSGSVERFLFLGALQLVQNDRDAIVRRFAAFVADVTDADDVAFNARGTAGPATVHASFAEHGGRRPVSGASLSYEKSSKGLEFGISIEYEDDEEERHEQDSGSSMEEKFSVALAVHRSSDSAQVCVACSKATAPPAAAHQLHRLVLAYLGSDATAGAAPLLSVFNFPPTNEPLPLPWDKTSCTQHPTLLHAAFERRAVEYPTRCALDFLHRSSTGNVRTQVSYRDALARVNDIGTSIKTLLGTLEWDPVRGSQRVIPLFMSQCPELYLAILAVMKSGNVFCPMPVDAPRQRLLDILDDTKSPVVMGVGPDPLGSAHHKSLDRLWLDVTDLTSWPGSWNRSGITRVATLEPGDLAYLYYTSGSTGKPKGVQISHLAATCAISANAAAMPRLSAEKSLRHFQMAVPTFDAFILDVFFTLSAGGTLCMADRDLLLTDVEGAINTLEANSTHTVPSLAMMMRKENVPTLTNVLCIGEQLNSKVIDSFAVDRRDASSVEHEGEGLVNLYGPTEATINVTIQTFRPDYRGSIIGSVLQTCSVVILNDKTLRPVPLGIPGHLAIGGPQLSHGYLNRPEENAKAFVQSDEFGRLYLTGDKARVVWDEEGQPVIECMGRISGGQVKLNGRRTELGEIDAVLMDTGGVVETATLAIQGNGAVILHTCAVAKPGTTESEAEDLCRQGAATALPKWMNPAKYFFFPALARNVSGKLDHKALTATIKELARPKVQEDPVIKRPLPRYDSGYGSIHQISNTVADAELPSILCAILKENLACDVKQTTSLFSVGFDSLQSIKFLQQARDFDVQELTITDLLKGPTPAELANLIIARRREADHDAAAGADREFKDSTSVYESPKLDAMLSGFDQRCREMCSEKIGVPLHDIEAVFPTTNIQTRMVATFHAAVEAHCPATAKPWVEHFPYDCPQSLNTHRFQEAVCTVLARHDCFRTAFVRVDDPVSPFAQVILSKSSPAATIPLTTLFCTDSMMEAQIVSAQRAADDYITMERPPLAVTFVRSSNAPRTVMVLSVFHGTYDGASLKLLREDIMANYLNEPAPDRLGIEAAVRLHYGADHKKSTGYWFPKFKTRPSFVLAGVPLPENFEDASEEQQKDVAVVAAHDSRALGSKMHVIQRLCTVSYGDLRVRSRANLQTTPLSVVQAAWALVLVECQQTMDAERAAAADHQPASYDVTFGSTVHGRNDEASRICMGTNMVTLPVCMAGMIGNDTNRTVCRILAVDHAEALGHLQLPCPSLEFALSAPRFDTTIIFQTFGEGAAEEHVTDFPGFGEGDDWILGYRGSDFRLPCTIELLPMKGGAIRAMCTYSSEFPGHSWLDEAAAKRMVDMFDANLSWLLDHPEATFDYRGRGEL